MNIAPSARALAALAGLSVTALGCASRGAPAPTTPGGAFDPQACAEEALRRGPDHALVVEAAERFSSGCTLGDAPSCSLLGVLNELGLGVPRDRGRARSLYRRACDAGNQRACGNLGALVLAALDHSDFAGSALALLRTACDEGHGRACGLLGRALARGEGAARDPEAAAGLFERACDRGDAPACVELVDLIQSGVGHASTAGAGELLEKACGYGDEEACERLGRRARALSPVLVGTREP